MNIHAMVVDDSGIMRKMVMKSLNESGLATFSFTEAVDGQDALGKMDYAAIQILFVDWNMPNMTGIELVREIRKAEPSHTPVVMVTTEGTMGRVEEAMDECGVDGYVVKPFTVEVLQKKLAPLFEKLRESTQKKGKGFFGKLAGKIA